jgi:hypothetical protein
MERNMTYEKAVNALIDVSLMNEDKTEEAITALKGHSVKFTYPDWAEALAEVGILARLDVDKAADVMQEAEEGGEDFDEALRSVGIW